MHEINHEVIEMAATVINALNSKQRTQVVNLLLKSPQEFSNINRMIPMKSTALSNQLKILEKAGIITYTSSRKEGRGKRYTYYIDVEKMISIWKYANALAGVIYSKSPPDKFHQ